eukprot:TRINITY_DN2517_c0_g2_i1.p1 TRINITY_DN2517_c0_g2~~TRINITY_DN2517_c0_g2_i1.p1  ORF type:complete len:901 (+),score=376.40 TRINITY_DN2517_c0_g2_i1:449-3151(+)
MTNFERQYWEIKMENWDTVLFFKKGKFYELYERDADIGHQEFDLKLTEVARSSMRMVGLPEQTFTLWASRFIGGGHKVGRVEQMQTRTQLERSGSKQAIVPRELCQILTLGTLTELEMLTDHQPNYIVSLKEVGASYGVVVADTSRGEFRFAVFKEDEQRQELVTLLHSTKPREIIIERGHLSKVATACIDKELGSQVRKTLLTAKTEYPTAEEARTALEESGFFPVNPPPPGLSSVWGDALVMAAFGAMCFYLKEAKLDCELLSMKNFGSYDPSCGGNALVLDGTTLANLEILESAAGRGTKGTLLEHVSHCVSPFGRRLLREWICAPLRSAASIRMRQDAVAELVEHVPKRVETMRFLAKLPDLERYLSRLGVAGREREVAWVDPASYNKKIVKVFIDTLVSLRDIHTFLTSLAGDEGFASPLLRELTRFRGAGGLVTDFKAVLDTFEKSFDFDEALATGKVVPNKGQNAKYDEQNEKLEMILADLDELLGPIKQHYKGVRGIRYVDFGKDKKLVEVPTPAVAARAAYDGLVQKTATKNVTRFIYTDAKALIEQHEATSDDLEAVKRGVLKEVLCNFAAEATMWKGLLQKLSALDCLCSLAVASSRPGWCRPVVHDREEGTRPYLAARNVMHPLVRPAVGSQTDNIVANDILLGGDEPPVSLITGPNMGGKSTVMRSACVVIIFAQLGCFVPADSVELTPVDRIFTRIGAMDRILSGLSTFMVEMRETSAILKSATENSFVVLDELGRGTATVDGYSIAYAVLQDISQRIRCRTMFSTHYHFLCHDVLTSPTGDIGMYRMAYTINPETRAVQFLYKYIRGATNESYGVDVAKKASISEAILAQAQERSQSFRSANQYQGDNVMATVARFARDAIASKDTKRIRVAKRKASDLESILPH